MSTPTREKFPVPVLTFWKRVWPCDVPPTWLRHSSTEFTECTDILFGFSINYHGAVECCGSSLILLVSVRLLACTLCGHTAYTYSLQEYRHQQTADRWCNAFQDPKKKFKKNCKCTFFYLKQKCAFSIFFKRWTYSLSYLSIIPPDYCNSYVLKHLRLIIKC